ncbi:MAP kinase-activating death domain protein-like [Vigna umbellata]|uniref:MAP kinase-activating death domain protein-like n=1 Tax=Vigna umbellata TaxID=87088 RepID=UPI001F5E5581|nr:MAP kinase-activating death domain protein-like [Vigna umbellata]
MCAKIGYREPKSPKTTASCEHREPKSPLTKPSLPNAEALAAPPPHHHRSLVAPSPPPTKARSCLSRASHSVAKPQIESLEPLLPPPRTGTVTPRRRSRVGRPSLRETASEPEKKEGKKRTQRQTQNGKEEEEERPMRHREPSRTSSGRAISTLLSPPPRVYCPCTS